MEFEIVVVLVLLGLFGTIMNTMTGGGGGVVFIPILILLLDMPPNNAIATSFVAVTVGAATSTFAYWRQGAVDYRAGFALGLLTLPGAFLGAFVTSLVPTRAFNSILGFAIISLALFAWFKRNPQFAAFKTNGTLREKPDYVVNRSIAYFFAVLTGVFAGIFGAGGGLIITPAMALAGFPIQTAVGTSRLIVLILSIGASTMRASLGQAEVTYTLWLSAGSFCGAVIGARLVKVISSTNLIRLVTLLIVALGVALVIDALV